MGGALVHLDATSLAREVSIVMHCVGNCHTANGGLIAFPSISVLFRFGLFVLSLSAVLLISPWLFALYMAGA